MSKLVDVTTVSRVSFSLIMNSKIYSTGVPSGSNALVQKMDVAPCALFPSIVNSVPSGGVINATGFGGTV